MYFYKENGKQCLDLKGSLILSFNNALVKTCSKSAGPTVIKAPDGYILNIGKFKFINRVYITFKIICFIWGKNKELIAANTNLNKPYLKAVPYSKSKNLKK